MSAEGFWPGEAPAGEEENVDEQEPAVGAATDWPQPHEQEAEAAPEAEAEPEAAADESQTATAVHVPGELDIPDGVAVLEGSPSGADRTVGVVVSRFNGEISNQLLEAALGA